MDYIAMIRLAPGWPKESNGMDECQKKHALPHISQLLTRARQDPSALNALFEEYRPYLRFHLQGDNRLNQIRPKADSSDVLQMTLIEAYRDFGAFRGTTQNELSAWLHTIANNTVIDLLRRYLGPVRDVDRELPMYATSKSASLILNLPQDKGAGAVSRIIRGEAALQLAKAVDELPPQQAEAISLRHLHEMPIKEIAERMEKTPGAVAGLLKRGTSTLRKRLPKLLGRNSSA